MNKEIFKYFMFGSVVLTVVGLILILSSTSLGMGMADSWINSFMNKFPEESIEFSELELRRTMHIQQIIVIGSILFFVGLLTTFVTLFKRFAK
ncbi:hypothetical protein [Alkalicoccobacillus gibsonii]|uniref:hypothetical protein n=1 Tax=Alkalicoccobacillus gibsonii TaxID=79881 RepID=UPI0019330BE3|nr:hypothetical protein [Alkalicoccobacillus gibsonii]MBM0067484.1 hypothetical protein [Alkalicoccobacillus gibsonii]